MPHTDIGFNIIFGLRDMKRIGYEIGSKYGNTVIFRNESGLKKKRKTILSKDQIIKGYQRWGDEFDGFQWVQKYHSHQPKVDKSNQTELDWGSDVDESDDDDDDEDGKINSSN